MNNPNEKTMDQLYVLIGSEYPSLTKEELNLFMSHLIDAVHILEKPSLEDTFKIMFDNEHDESAGADCPNCGGEREWCEGCRMWTRTCCEQYGTCMCS